MAGPEIDLAAVIGLERKTLRHGDKTWEVRHPGELSIEARTRTEVMADRIARHLRDAGAAGEQHESDELAAKVPPMVMKLLEIVVIGDLDDFPLGAWEVAVDFFSDAQLNMRSRRAAAIAPPAATKRKRR